jgi:flagellar hook-length control protein FliK
MTAHGAAVTAAMNQVAQEAGQTRPGTVRDLELRLRTDDLGAVRVRLTLDRAGGVKVEVRTASEQAAQALRAGVPQLADALAARHLALSSATVQMMGGAQFGNSNHPRQQPRWVERTRRNGPGAGEAGEPVLAGVGVAAYGRAAAGVDMFA